MATASDDQKRGLTHSQIRLLWAALLAFVLPGLFVDLPFILFPNFAYGEGQARPHGVSEWALQLMGFVLGGALFGAPIVIVSLILWIFLARRRFCRLWTFWMIGFLSGLIFPALFFGGKLVNFVTLDFVASGALTATCVWGAAYWRPGRKQASEQASRPSR